MPMRCRQHARLWWLQCTLAETPPIEVNKLLSRNLLHLRRSVAHLRSWEAYFERRVDRMRKGFVRGCEEKVTY